MSPRRTPARVQVFFFEKKPNARKTTTLELDEPRTTIDMLPALPSRDDPFEGFESPAPPAHESTVRTQALRFDPDGKPSLPQERIATVRTGSLPLQQKLQAKELLRQPSARPPQTPLHAPVRERRQDEPTIPSTGDRRQSPTNPELEAFKPPRPGTSGAAPPLSRKGGLAEPDRDQTLAAQAEDPHTSRRRQQTESILRKPGVLIAHDVDTDPGDLGAVGGQEAMEYHRQKLEGLASHPTEESGSLVELALFAHDLYARGRIREAQVVLEGLVAREPDEAFAYTMLGAVYHSRGDDTRALALFDMGLTLDRTDLAALVGRAEIRLKRGEPKQAVKDLEKAVAADPGGRDPFSERARALSVLARTLSRMR